MKSIAWTYNHTEKASLKLQRKIFSQNFRSFNSRKKCTIYFYRGQTSWSERTERGKRFNLFPSPFQLTSRFNGSFTPHRSPLWPYSSRTTIGTCTAFLKERCPSPTAPEGPRVPCVKPKENFSQKRLSVEGNGRSLVAAGRSRGGFSRLRKEVLAAAKSPSLRWSLNRNWGNILPSH